MAFRLARPAHLIDINGIAGLNSLSVQQGALSIGALVRHADFHRPVFGGPLGVMLAAVARHIAHYPIRQRGTFCGSLAHADPAAEWTLVAATLDADLVAIGPRGERTLSAREFFRGAMETDLAPEELLREARLPLLLDGSSFGFAEFRADFGGDESEIHKGLRFRDSIALDMGDRDGESVFFGFARAGSRGSRGWRDTTGGGRSVWGQ